MRDNKKEMDRLKKDAIVQYASNHLPERCDAIKLKIQYNVVYAIHRSLRYKAPQKF
jgi:hypothetical protein